MVTLFDATVALPNPGRVGLGAFFSNEWRLLPSLMHAQVGLVRSQFFSRTFSSFPSETIRARQRVILIPGFGASQATLEPLRRYFSHRGLCVAHWGLGVNYGDVEKNCERLIERLLRDYGDYAGEIILVGWSMGGALLARWPGCVPIL